MATASPLAAQAWATARTALGLPMRWATSIAVPRLPFEPEDAVPSTGEPDPYMHVFLDAGAGNILAFFELPTKPPMDRDRNTPTWTQHLAMEVDSMDELLAAKARMEADGIEVVGPTDHTIFKSIYFRDPSGHRLELAVNTGTPEMLQKLDAVKWDMLNEWARTKKAPKHAAWMHDGSHSAKA